MTRGQSPLVAADVCAQGNTAKYHGECRGRQKFNRLHSLIIAAFRQAETKLAREINTRVSRRRERLWCDNEVVKSVAFPGGHGALPRKHFGCS